MGSAPGQWRYVAHWAGRETTPDLASARTLVMALAARAADPLPEDAPRTLREFQEWLAQWAEDFTVALASAGAAHAFSPGGELAMAVQSAIQQASGLALRGEDRDGWARHVHAVAVSLAVALGYGRLVPA